MATCANHPIKMATARCKCCNKPLCNECKQVTDLGIFCSAECESRTRQFMERADGYAVTYKRTFFTKKQMRGLLILVLLIGAAAGVLYFGMGVTPGGVKATLAKWWEARRLFLPW
jgi:hypothetical protein